MVLDLLHARMSLFFLTYWLNCLLSTRSYSNRRFIEMLWYLRFAISISLWPVINISFKSLMFRIPWYLGYPQCLPVGKCLERSAQISRHDPAWRVHLVSSSPEIHTQTSDPPTAKEKHVSGKYFITRYPGVRLGHQGLVTLCTGRADILCYRFIII